ncbi:hypothetical protein ACW9KT_15550 [Hymenobacter sp. HD11105]
MMLTHLLLLLQAGDSAASAIPKAQVPTNSGPPVLPVPSHIEISLSEQVLYFGFFLIIIEALLIKIRNIEDSHALRLITVTLIITSILFLTTAGYGDRQLAPATGLLGTIAGYLLGRNSNQPSTPHA